MIFEVRAVPQAVPSRREWAMEIRRCGIGRQKKSTRGLTKVHYCTICSSTVIVVALNIVISTGSSTPIYRQIAEQVRLAVGRGRLEVGDQLPSVRPLAERLVLNPNTAARAYSDRRRE